MMKTCQEISNYFNLEAKYNKEYNSLSLVDSKGKILGIFHNVKTQPQGPKEPTPPDKEYIQLADILLENSSEEQIIPNEYPFIIFDEPINDSSFTPVNTTFNKKHSIQSISNFFNFSTIVSPNLSMFMGRALILSNTIGVKRIDKSNSNYNDCFFSGGWFAIGSKGNEILGVLDPSIFINEENLDSKVINPTENE